MLLCSACARQEVRPFVLCVSQPDSQDEQLLLHQCDLF